MKDKKTELSLAQRVNNLSDRLKKLEEAIDLPDRKKKIEILESESQNPNLWNDPVKAKETMRELSDTKKEVSEIEDLVETVSTLEGLLKEESLTSDFEKELKDTERSLERLELISFLSGEYDRKNAIISIHAGQGGTEAMDWASMLFRMYRRYCERRGWETSILDYTQGDEAGIKSVTLKVVGVYSYGYLKGEAGTHRLVRQSPFNADKLRQTSFALVEVLPELEEADLPDIAISEDELDWQFFRSSSQGGQNVQKVSTAVRLTHKPTGIVVTAQSERFQEQNRKIALSLLRAKLWLLYKEMENKTKKELKGDYRPASWGNQIRSYVLHPYKMIKDLRTDVETSDVEAVLDGELTEFVEAELKTKT